MGLIRGAGACADDVLKDGRHSMRRGITRAAVGAAVLSLGGAAGAAQAQTGDLDGFTPGRAATQRQYEQRFQEGVSADAIRSLSRTLSRRPHLVGTPNQRRVIDTTLAKLRGYGLEARLQAYDIYVSRPESIQVSMT